MHSHKIDFLGINLDHFISTVYCFSFVCVRVFQVLGAETKPAEEVLWQENNAPPPHNDFCEYAVLCDKRDFVYANILRILRREEFP